MCSRSLTQAHLPSTQKAAIVTPILKKAGLDSTELKNYRPTSNLSFLSKVIERLMFVRISEYLRVNHLLPSVQSAYRGGHSIETTILKVASDVWDGVDRGMVTLLGLWDLSAAFDTVYHGILWRGLELALGLAKKLYYIKFKSYILVT